MGNAPDRKKLVGFSLNAVVAQSALPLAGDCQRYIA